MRYKDNGTRFIKTSRIRELWDSCIPNISSLREHVGVSGFVAIDAEPLGQSATEIAEIALAFLPSLDVTKLSCPPTSLKTLQDRYAVQVYRIVVAGRKQGNMRNRQ